MTSSVENLGSLKREMTFVIPVNEVNAAYHKRLSEIAKTIKINGFRPGKVPFHVIEQRFSGGLLEEVAHKLMEAHFQKITKEGKIQLAGQFTVTDTSIKKNEDLTFKAEFEVYPEIHLNTLTGVTIEREKANIVDDDLNQMLEKFRKAHATYQLVEREARLDDQVVIDFDGSIGGEAFEGGQAKQHTLVLGSKRMIPGFEEGIVGMSVGEIKDIQVKFPDDYHSENLEGKEATFHIVLHKVEESCLPTLEDLPQKMDAEGGLDALKQKTRDAMVRELHEKLRARLKNSVMEKLLELNPIEVPTSLVTAEANHLKRIHLQEVADRYHIKIDMLEKMDLFNNIDKTEEAKKRVSLGLLIAEVIKKYDIRLDEAKLHERIKEVASYYKDAEEVKEWYMHNEDASSQMKAAVIEEQAVDVLLQDANVFEKVVSYHDVVS